MEPQLQTVESSKFWYLKKTNLLRDLPEEELGFITTCSRMTHPKKGEIIFLQGDPAYNIFFLKEGRVKLSRTSPDGREITLDLIEKGELFGELAVYDEGVRNTQAQALEDSILCAMKKSDFLEVLNRNPQLNFKLAKFVAFRRLQLESKMDELIFADVPTRLSRLLLSLKPQFGEESSKGVKFRVALSHHEMGNLIGATRETVSAALARWKKDGIVESEGRKLVLLDISQLEKLAGAVGNKAD